MISLPTLVESPCRTGTLHVFKLQENYIFKRPVDNTWLKSKYFSKWSEGLSFDQSDYSTLLHCFGLQFFLFVVAARRKSQAVMRPDQSRSTKSSFLCLWSFYLAPMSSFPQVTTNLSWEWRAKITYILSQQVWRNLFFLLIHQTLRAVNGCLGVKVFNHQCGPCCSSMTLTRS